jgi:TPR repeat protein
MSADGNCVPKDAAEAANWLRKAAQQGDPKGQLELGNIYHEGTGVPKDAQEAAKWTRRAAEQGNGHAQFNLGVMYALGDGVTKDNVQAYAWWAIAATQSERSAAKNCAALERRMTTEQIEEGKKFADAFKPKPERPADGMKRP